MTIEINSKRSEQIYNLQVPNLGEDICRLTGGFRLRHHLEMSQNFFDKMQ